MVRCPGVTKLDIFIFVILLIKYTIEQNDIEVNHCPTEKMIADFYTKPQQGK